MKKKYSIILLAIIFIIPGLPAQVTRPGSVRQGVITKTLPVQKSDSSKAATQVVPAEESKPTQPIDKVDQFQIIRAFGTTFSATNFFDGSPKSYNHTMQISIGLVPEGILGGSNFQLVFYSPSDKIAQACYYESQQQVLLIYYPISMYDYIKEELAKAFDNNKKITIRITQRADGYREGNVYF